MIETILAIGLLVALNGQVNEVAGDPNTAVKVALITMFGGVMVALIGLAGLIVQTHSVGRKVDTVKAEVSRNGGRSTKDQVVAANGAVRKIERRLEAGGQRMDQIEGRLDGIEAGVQLLLHAAGIDPDEPEEAA